MSSPAELPPVLALPHTFVAKEEQYVLRPLHGDDYHKGYLDLLSQLSDPGVCSEAEFRATLEKMSVGGDGGGCGVRTLVVEHTASGRIAASASLLSEQKFLRGCKKVGHIEDVVTSEAHRQRGLARIVLSQILAEARAGAEFYKIILDCTEENAPVYAKLGMFKTGEIQMRYNF